MRATRIVATDPVPGAPDPSRCLHDRQDHTCLEYGQFYLGTKIYVQKTLHVPTSRTHESASERTRGKKTIQAFEHGQTWAEGR